MDKIEISLPKEVQELLRLLEAKGFEGWCVGGCVRDSLLGRAPGDWDVTTNALPEEIKDCFSQFSTIDTGLKHGTVTVILGGLPIEVTTYRSDGAYLDHRHPERVRFCPHLEDDLSRRDFTINALAYHPKQGLLDRFGGIEDLRCRLLRCVGDPERRFTEDALRILRCLRFSSVLGFSIDPFTGKALLEKSGLLSAVSPERIQAELSKLLTGAAAEQVLREYSPVLFSVLPELAPMKDCGQENPYHCFDVWEHSLHVLGAAAPDPFLRWAALLHDCGKPGCKFYDSDSVAHFYRHETESTAIAEQILLRLRFSRRDMETILALVRRHGEHPPLPEKRIKRLLAELEEENLFRLFALMKADLSAQAPHLYQERIGGILECEALAREILKRNDCLTLRQLAVNGHDLMELGIPPGPALGKLLNALLEEVLDGRLQNEKTALLARSGEIVRSSRTP